jgi:hypothetical protein
VNLRKCFLLKKERCNKMVSLIEKINGNKANIFFNEWKVDSKKIIWHKILLEKVLDPETRNFKDTEYYIFKGCFLEENEFRVKPKIQVNFWFTEKSFSKELIRWINVNKIEQPFEKYSAIILVTRISKTEINFNGVDLFD